MEREPVYTERPLAGNGFFQRISWSAVFAGVLIALITQLVLSLLGVGIGLSTVDPVTEKNPTSGLGIGAGIWYLVSSVLSLFAGSWVAGRLSSAPRLFDGMIHGILTWSLVTLVTVYLLSTAVGRVIGGVGSMLGGVMSAAGTGIAAAAPNVADAAKEQFQKNGVNLDLGDLKNEVNQLLRQTGKPGLQPNALKKQANQAVGEAKNAAGNVAENPQAADESSDNIIGQFVKQGNGVANQFDREAAVNVVMKRTGKTRPEAEQIVDNWTKTYQQAQVKFEKAKSEAEIQARHAADAAAKGASTAAILAAIGLLLGAAVAGYAARLGTDSKDDYNRFDRPVGTVR